MNLETLLEAAKYVEYSSKVKARGEEPDDYNTFERQRACDDQSLTRSHQKSHIKSDPDTPKEKRRFSGGLVSKEISVFSDETQGIGTREVHNKLEKNRRAHLKECFETLKRQLPSIDERKTSNLSILRGALRYIQTLKRREREYEHEMERLAREKIAAQQKLAALKKEFSTNIEHIDVSVLASEGDNETTTTASECGQLSDIDDDDDDDDDDGQHDISSTSLHINSSSSEIASPASSTMSNAGTSDGITGTITMGSLSADDTLLLSKSARSSFSSEEVTSSMVTTTSSPLLTSLAAASTTCLSKLQASVTSSSLTSGNSVLHGTSSISQPPPTHVSLSSQVPGSRSFQVSTMTGMLTSPHTVQVITQHGGVKVITTPNAIANSAPVCNTVTSAPIQNGPLHILTSSASLVALGSPSTAGAPNIVTTSPKTSGTQSLVRVAPLSAVNSAKHIMSPVTLVAPHSVVGVTQVTTAPKSIIINQVAGLSASPSGTTVASSVTVKSTMTPSSSALSASGNILTAVATQPNVVTPLQTSHIVQSGMTARSIATSQVLTASAEKVIAFLPIEKGYDFLLAEKL